MKLGKARSRRYTAVAAVATLGLLAAACGGGGGSAGSTSGGTKGSTSSTSSTSSATVKTQTVSVGVLPIADVAPLYLGIKQGFFAKQHLTVQAHALQGGAAVASAVVGGSLQFGFGATANLVLAKAKNLPVQFVANGDEAASTANRAWSGILVNGSSGITSVSQLAGKTIAANATEGENELAIDSILKQHGVKPTSVKIVAIGFPTMPSALANGQVDAVSEPEPFVSAIEAKGGKLLTPLFEGMQPSLLVAGYFAKTTEISKDPALVKRFVTAINQSLDYAQSHPSAVRAIIPTYTKIPATVAAKMHLPDWGSALKTSSIKAQEKLMKTLGWLSSTVPISQLVWSGAKS